MQVSKCSIDQTGAKDYDIDHTSARYSNGADQTGNRTGIRNADDYSDGANCNSYQTGRISNNDGDNCPIGCDPTGSTYKNGATCPIGREPNGRNKYNDGELRPIHHNAPGGDYHDGHTRAIDPTGKAYNDGDY